MKKTEKHKKKKEDKDQFDEPCGNCKRMNHKTTKCYFKGGVKEGQGPRQKKNANKSETVVVAANNNEGELFVFTCALDHAAVVEAKEGQDPKKKNIQQRLHTKKNTTRNHT